MGEAFHVLTGLNLHPARLTPWRDVLSGSVCAPPRSGFTAHAQSDPWRPVDWDPAVARTPDCAERWLDILSQSLTDGDRQQPDISGQEVAPSPVVEISGVEIPGVKIPVVKIPVDQSLFGYSLGGLLGLLHMMLHPGSWQRGILISPALRLKPIHRFLLRRPAAWLPPGLGLPSFAPRAYRHHAQTTVAAFRGVADLEARLAPYLERILAGSTAVDAAGNTTLPPPLFIAYAPGDELIDTAVLADLAAAHPDRISTHILNHKPRPLWPIHLGIDEATLGEKEWVRLTDAVGVWLEETGLEATHDDRM